MDGSQALRSSTLVTSATAVVVGVIVLGCGGAGKADFTVESAAFYK